MSGAQEAIKHPLLLDFSTRPVPALKFLLQESYSPVGVLERPSPEVTYRPSPWYTQVAVELIGIDATAVLYAIPRDEETVLLAACLGETFEPFFKLLTGDDFGDSVTKLTADHWPEIYSMLRASNDVPARGRVLCSVITPGRVQWVVADHMRLADSDQIPNERLLDLIGTSLQTFLRATNVALELPGVVDVVGGPDRLSRRLAGLSALLGATATISKTLEGGVDGDELIELGKAAREAVESMLELRRPG